MGQQIEKVALERGHEIVLTIESDNFDLVTQKDLQRADVAIEFSTPGSVLYSIQTCLNAGLPIVVGTTGWHEKTTVPYRVQASRHQLHIDRSSMP